MPTLDIINLHKTFGDTRALDGMSLSVRPGEIYGFVGSNGAGKSTTMRIALGVLEADEGEVLFDAQPIDNSARRRIGYMPEERGLYGKEKILEQLVFLGTLHGLTAAEATANATGLLAQLGLEERAGDKVDDLSLGNQQRVQLAASLVHDPEILILDEPFSGLDPVAVDVMSQMLLTRARERGIPVLFSSHQLDLVQRLCDRVGIVARGRMVAEGTVAELRTRGPVRYEVLTEARGWYPAETRIVTETPGRVVLEPAPGAPTGVDQRILRAALDAGPVRSFAPVTPDLTELFKEAVQP